MRLPLLKASAQGLKERDGRLGQTLRFKWRTVKSGRRLLASVAGSDRFRQRRGEDIDCRDRRRRLGRRKQRIQVQRRSLTLIHLALT